MLLHVNNMTTQEHKPYRDVTIDENILQIKKVTIDTSTQLLLW